MAAPNRMSLTVDAVLRIRDLYAEKDGRRPYLPRYSHAEIARMMDCSETTVFRVINRLGAYAWVGGESLVETKDDPAIAAAAKASLERLQAMMAAAPVDDQPEPAGSAMDPEVAAAAAAIAAKVKTGN